MAAAKGVRTGIASVERKIASLLYFNVVDPSADFWYVLAGVLLHPKTSVGLYLAAPKYTESALEHQV
jgi:hypothetical protein